MTLTVQQALAQAAMLDSETARLDAEILLSHAVDKPRTWLFTWPEALLSPEQAQCFSGLMRRRQAGEPVAYITGRRAFWNFDIRVDKSVLIPRPETELLVEVALRHLDRNASIADLGTGSGAIALAIASERTDSLVIAIDRSAQALALARANADELGLRNIEFRHGDWCRPLASAALDMVVSNPPYIAEGDPHLQQGDLRFEPRTALVAAGDGLDDIDAICRQARDCLRPGGMLLLEHGYNQAGSVRDILRRGGYTEIESVRDLQGHERVTSGRVAMNREQSDAR